MRGRFEIIHFSTSEGEGESDGTRGKSVMVFYKGDTLI